ncbi:saccharopine dehydrogenase family protein [Lyngbya confervoides]|uniref:Saccharopine dehydrogenase NADP-binding domain-containing protein n=1 Tax=Lyngbya confervoides BDU141951 TaxID=1574623 RepID=A0ABD4T5A0_9CYAN|nr:saccharopine dehydrogenase NADP-binding domain-containing protein [Lyngbya confervoides]MCM1983593.1 saccharopine dehydrogenase NADP-binding domain-containing protein [Lyngbya confervoides BDU141951]
MIPSVLILGGTGRIGQAVATDLRSHTHAAITLTGRRRHCPIALHSREHYLCLNLADVAAVERAIQTHHLVIHCAGPFRDRSLHVLQTCLRQQIPYLDVADSPDYVKQALTLRDQAIAQGVIAVVSTGVFPGISCSMVRQSIEQLDQADDIHLSYLVGGSGGAGVTVMRTTFLELQTPFLAKQQRQWQTIRPYSQREVLRFPEFGQGGVYWFNTIEAMTLAESFPDVQTITTKFGSVPDLYNHLTWLVAQAPQAWLRNPQLIEFLSQVSYRMTQVSDRWSGIGIAMRLAVSGQVNQQPIRLESSFYSPDTAAAAGQGAGLVAQLILEKKLTRPGVWSVEQVLPTPLFQASMEQRNLRITAGPPTSMRN